MTAHAFRLAKFAMVWIIATSAVAMFAYPGGTFLDASTHGYSFFHNSFSDLGATVAFGGQSNLVSAIVFDMGFAAMLLALLPAFVALICGSGGQLPRDNRVRSFTK